jgi:hypothetical protein
MGLNGTSCMCKIPDISLYIYYHVQHYYLLIKDILKKWVFCLYESLLHANAWKDTRIFSDLIKGCLLI